MKDIGNLINGYNPGEVKQNRNFVYIKPHVFKDMVLHFGNIEVKKNDPNLVFKIDKNNTDILNQLYFYLIGSPLFKGNLHKGIILIGGFGSGKTTLISVFSSAYAHIHRKVVHFVSAVELVEIIKYDKIDEHPERHISYLEKRPLIIDEIGRENARVMVYGTERLPMHELLTMRYNSGGLTLGTSNLDYEALKNLYGEYIGDRMKEMFNFIILDSESRRK